VKVSLRTSLQEHPVDIRHIYDTHTQRTYKMATDDPAAPSQQQRPSQVRIHLHTNSEDIQLPQDTGPILVSTGKSGAGAASTACTLPFYPPASIHTDERVACPRPYSALWGSKLQSSVTSPKGFIVLKLGSCWLYFALQFMLARLYERASGDGRVCYASGARMLWLGGFHIPERFAAEWKSK